MSLRVAFFLPLLAVLAPLPLGAAELDFRDQELPTRLTVGYAVRLIDMNEDQRLDIVIVDSKRILWLENPNWQEHVLIEDESQQNDNVTFAPYDINGDGKLDFAVGADWQFNNTESGGTIGWITAENGPAEPWTYYPISEEPTVHRIRFADIDGDGKQELIVAPLKGRNTSPPDFAENGVRLLAYDVPENPTKDAWPVKTLNDDTHVMHNFWPTDFNRDGQLDLLLASFEGVSLLERGKDGEWQRTRIGAGEQQRPPARGASEIKHGRLAGGGDYIATIEPWHGDKVVVYTRPDQPRPASGEWLWSRHVLDEDLKWGHAVWCADLDDDEDEELIIGVRDDKDSADRNQRRGLRIYDPADGGQSWTRTLVDPGSVAIEDAAAADLNGDGRIDIVAVGRQTHNVKIYWNETK